jgi:hypothetical protein
MRGESLPHRHPFGPVAGLGFRAFSRSGFACDNHYSAHMFGQRGADERCQHLSVGESNQFKILRQNWHSQRQEIGSVVDLHVREIADAGNSMEILK